MIAIARPESVFHPRRPHALALSVVLHGALMAAWMLAPTPPLHDLGAGALPIQLVIEPPPPAPAPPAPAPVEAPSQVQPPPQPTPKPVAAKPVTPPKPVAPKPAVKTETVPATAAVPAATEAAAPVEAAVPPVQTGAGLTETAEAAPAAAAPIGAPNARNAAHDEYMGVVWARIMRYRPARVPTTGTTRLRFTLAADGELVSVEIADSSGSGLLDRAALNAVRRAAPFPPPPPTTAPVQHFEIPFQFRPNA